MEIGEVIVTVVMFATIFGIVYLAISAKNRERMALIEKGADASDFFSGKSRGSGKWILTLGIFTAGIALGVLIGYLLESGGMRGDVAYPASIFLFGGASLIAAYFIGKKVNGHKA